VARRQRGEPTVYVLVCDDALAECGSWNCAYRALFFPLPRALVIGEEEQSVLANRSPDRNTEDISDQFVGNVRLPTVELCLLDEVIVSAGKSVAVVFVERPMKHVSPTLGDQGN